MAMFKELETIDSLLYLVRNPKELDGFLKRVQEMTNGYVQAIEAVTKLHEVDSYVTDVKKKQVEMITTLNNAESKARKIEEEAKQKAEALRLNAETVQTEARKLLKEAQDLKQQMELESNAIRQKSQEVNLKLQQVKEKEKYLESLKVDLEAKRTKLMSALQ
jgi:chromosome segregation ATPase